MNNKLKCFECKGQIIEVINQTLYCYYDEDLKDFKVSASKLEDSWFKCDLCEAEYNKQEVKDLLKK